MFYTTRARNATAQSPGSHSIAAVRALQSGLLATARRERGLISGRIDASAGRDLRRPRVLPAPAPHGQRQGPGPLERSGEPADAPAHQGPQAWRRHPLRRNGAPRAHNSASPLHSTPHHTTPHHTTPPHHSTPLHSTPHHTTPLHSTPHHTTLHLTNHHITKTNTKHQQLCTHARTHAHARKLFQTLFRLSITDFPDPLAPSRRGGGGDGSNVFVGA